MNPVEDEDVDIEVSAEPPRFEDPLLQVNPEEIVDLGEDIQQAQEPIEIEFNFMNKIEDEGEMKVMMKVMTKMISRIIVSYPNLL